MGRLDDIIERNKHPGKTRKHRGLSVGFAMIVVFVVLILLIFTDLANPPEDDRLKVKPAPVEPATPAVRGLQLWRAPVRSKQPPAQH